MANVSLEDSQLLAEGEILQRDLLMAPKNQNTARQMARIEFNITPKVSRLLR